MNWTLEPVLAQILLGLVNGSFYAVLSLGLAVIFGLLSVINFAHGAFFMIGAMLAWMGGHYLGLGYWTMLLLAPLAAMAFGMIVERAFLRRLYGIDHLYGLLMTLGITQVMQGLLRSSYGVSGQPYEVPAALSGVSDLGFMVVPDYRLWVVVAALLACLATWLTIEKTKVGSYLRSGTENRQLVAAFGINVPLMMTITYGAGVGLAAFAGVLAAPVMRVSPLMGENLIILVFAIVVIGGMGSVAGSVMTALALGVVEAVTKMIYPEASSTVVFLIMILVLLTRPAGLFGRSAA
jgi:branched-chain amino acid transport system permease protein